jgi:hypothetical protein
MRHTNYHSCEAAGGNGDELILSADKKTDRKSPGKLRLERAGITLWHVFPTPVSKQHFR